MYTDSHTHLNSPQLFPDYMSHIQDFLDSGGVGLSIIGTNFEDSKLAIEIVENSRDDLLGRPLKFGATIGYHPEFARDCDIGALEELIIKYNGYTHERRSLDLEATDSKPRFGKTEDKTIIGIGEIGTDLYREPYRKFYDIQKKAFYDQCQLAIKYNLPIIIHSRNDFEGTMEVLDKVTKLLSSEVTKSEHSNLVTSQLSNLKVYFHCRGYTTKELEILNDLINSSKSNSPLSKGDQGGLRVGFCGNISYPKAQELRESFQYCLDHDINILIETDAPYLAAQAIRGQQNTPAKIIHTYQYISDYFNIPLSELQQKTHDNFMSLYYPSLATDPSV